MSHTYDSKFIRINRDHPDIPLELQAEDKARSIACDAAEAMDIITTAFEKLQLEKKLQLEVLERERKREKEKERERERERE